MKYLLLLFMVFCLLAGCEEPKTVVSNTYFDLIEPVDDKIISGPFNVKGSTNVSGNEFYYTFEDGHNILASGTVQTEASETSMKAFEFTVKFDKPTSPYGTLTLYDSLNSDGNPNHFVRLSLSFATELLVDEPQ